MADDGTWYEGKAFTPGVQPPEVMKFEGEGAKDHATLWFAQRRESGVCDSVYVVEVKGEARETVLSWSDTYLTWLYEDNDDGEDVLDWSYDRFYDDDDGPDDDGWEQDDDWDPDEAYEE